MGIYKLGFFVIVTSKEMTASEALDICRKRDSVEKIFRMLKTGLEYDTFRVHSQDSLEGKTYVMFIASIVRNYLFQGLKKVSQKENDKGYKYIDHCVISVYNDIDGRNINEAKGFDKET